MPRFRVLRTAVIQARRVRAPRRCVTIGHVEPDANFVLALLAGAFADHDLEMVLIGKMAAALRGDPVRPIDVDFMFRKTPRNMAKLRSLAVSLNGTLFRPFYPRGDFYRLYREHDGLQVNFRARVKEWNSFEDLRRAATPVWAGDERLLVAPVPGFSKVVELEEDAVVREKSEALKKESDLALRDLIRRRLDMTVEQRIAHSLRRKIGLRATVI